MPPKSPVFKAFKKIDFQKPARYTLNIKVVQLFAQSGKLDFDLLFS